MKMVRPCAVLLGAIVAHGIVTNANAAQRLQSIVQRASAAEAQTNAAAAKTLRIAGTTVDADGKPVAGAIVECYQAGGSTTPLRGNEFEVKKHLTTGADGAFELQVPPVTTVLLARKPGLAPAWAQYWNLLNDMTGQRLILTPPTTLTGVVVDQTDKPVTDAEVWLSYACVVRGREEGGQSYSYLNGKPLRELFSTRTGVDGKFVIEGFPTNTSAEPAVRKAGMFLREPQREGISPDTMRWQPGQHDVKLIVEPAGNIEGKVVTKDSGQALTGFSLWPQPTQGSYFGGGERKPAESGADGKFRLADMAPGNYELHATFGTNQPPDWVAERVPVSVESGQTTRDVRVSATRGGFLEVKVLGKKDSQPVAGVSINAHKEAYQGGAGSGTNGFALLRLPAGQYKVTAYKDNSRSEGSDATVEDGRTNRLEIELNPPPMIAGTVRDPSGAAVPNLQLAAFPSWGQSGGATKTDAKGHYEMAWNPPTVRTFGRWLLPHRTRCRAEPCYRAGY
jgi:hypothetical protein